MAAWRWLPSCAVLSETLWWLLRRWWFLPRSLLPEVLRRLLRRLRRVVRRLRRPWGALGAWGGRLTLWGCSGPGFMACAGVSCGLGAIKNKGSLIPTHHFWSPRRNGR